MYTYIHTYTNTNTNTHTYIYIHTHLPLGESYLDVIERVRPVIIELERQKRSIVLVCHMAVLRCIYAYFMGVALPDIPVKPFMKHHVYELSPGPFGCTCAVIDPLDQSTTQEDG
jgi:broad specificity phosphatase PhoE